MKSRNISVYDYLQALQQEYICLEIRNKIYAHKDDRNYFRSLMDKKKQNIIALARKNDLTSIFDDEDEYLVVWDKIVPHYGLPKFIYNIVNVSDKQLTFPYKGTVVEVLETGKYGVTERVNFSDNTVTITVDGQLARYGYDDVKRLNHQDTDEFFYFFPHNHFKAFISGKEQVGKLQSYDMKKKSAILNFDGTCITLQHDEIRRVL
jgi:hypothetical protein